jgi:hypothetical protein
VGTTAAAARFGLWGLTFDRSESKHTALEAWYSEDLSLDDTSDPFGDGCGPCPTDIKHRLYPLSCRLKQLCPSLRTLRHVYDNRMTWYRPRAYAFEAHLPRSLPQDSDWLEDITGTGERWTLRVTALQAPDHW